MEISAMPPMPLDFSMVRSGNGSPGAGLRESPRPVSNSAFRVVTPKGKENWIEAIDIFPKFDNSINRKKVPNIRQI